MLFPLTLTCLQTLPSSNVNVGEVLYTHELTAVWKDTDVQSVLLTVVLLKVILNVLYVDLYRDYTAPM